jgi:putative acetyltransferase
MADLRVRPENPDDREAVREVNRQAFGREGEARLVDALQGGGYARLSPVAEEGGRVVGHVEAATEAATGERGHQP